MQAIFDGLACDEAAPTCAETCGKPLQCQQHDCLQRCHAGAQDADALRPPLCQVPDPQRDPKHLGLAPTAVPCQVVRLHPAARWMI